MGRTRIKVCGITEKSDALHAIEAGVDALGFIFAEKSPRLVEPDQVKEIVRVVPPFVDTVGVFVNEDPDVVTDIVQYCGLTMLQLHGKETVNYCELIPRRRIIKSFSVDASTESEEFNRYEEVAIAYLLDTYHETLAGGTGRVFDWGLLEKLEIPGPVILAGGLGPENIEEAIRIARPYAVDVNSGVEIEPGRKDHEKISRLVRAVREVDERLASEGES